MEIIDTAVESAAGPMWPVWAGIGLIVAVVIFMRLRKRKASAGKSTRPGDTPKQRK